MITRSHKETLAYGQKFAWRLKGGEVIGLVGELGSGKTTFTQALAKALHVKENITSPTFVILKNYPAKIDDKKIDFVHVDAYRMEKPEDIESVGLSDYLNRQDTIIVIEWADKIKKILPKGTIYINFDYIAENTRKISVKNTRWLTKFDNLLQYNCY